MRGFNFKCIFRDSSGQPLPNAVYSSAVLMGYLAGAKLPSLIDEARRGRDRSK